MRHFRMKQRGIIVIIISLSMSLRIPFLVTLIVFLFQRRIVFISSFLCIQSIAYFITLHRMNILPNNTCIISILLVVSQCAESLIVMIIIIIISLCSNNSSSNSWSIFFWMFFIFKSMNISVIPIEAARIPCKSIFLIVIELLSCIDMHDLLLEFHDFILQFLQIRTYSCTSFTWFILRFERILLLLLLLLMLLQLLFT